MKGLHILSYFRLRFLPRCGFELYFLQNAADDVAIVRC